MQPARIPLHNHDVVTKALSSVTILDRPSLMHQVESAISSIIKSATSSESIELILEPSVAHVFAALIELGGGDPNAPPLKLVMKGLREPVHKSEECTMLLMADLALDIGKLLRRGLIRYRLGLQIAEARRAKRF